LFDAVAGPSGLAPATQFARPEAARRLLDAAAFKTRSLRSRAITVAAVKAFDELATLKCRNLDYMRGNYKRGDTALNNLPKLIHVELSTACNLRCRFCSITRPGREREIGYIDLDTIERLRPYLPFISDCKLHGGGEPFLHPKIERVLEIFREEGVRLNTVTNATVITERLGKLIGDTFTSLTVSVDGATKDVYEYARPRAKWEKLLRGLDRVNRHRNPDLRLIIGVVMLKCNIHQLPDLVRFTKEQGGQELQAAWLVPFHDLPWTYEQGLTDDPERTNHFMDEARRVGRELGVSVRIPDALPVGEAAHRRADQGDERGADRAGAAPSTIKALEHRDTYWDLHGTTKVEGHCRLMYDRCMILADGQVKPCGQSRMVERLGNVNQQPFEACWNSDAYQELRGTFNGGTLPRTCRSCNFIRSKQLGTARLVYD
jgi:radical SAM protein with 4Fe4S-binding SPASM domain